MNAPIFETIEGKFPVLLSAPHVYPHRRPNLGQSYKSGEPITDEIVKEICAKNSTYGIFLNDESDFDPNYHLEKSNPYKRKVREVVSDDKIGHFFDIHGLKDGQMYDIGIYYPSGFSRSIKLAREIKEALDQRELRGCSVAIFRFPKNFQKPLGNFVASKLRVPSVQIEIGRYVREDEQLKKSFIENISDVVATLSK